MYYALRWLPLVLVALAGSSALGASPFSPGEEVEINYQNEWRPGKVLSTTATGQVSVEFDFAGRRVNQAFKPVDVRHAYEVDALTREREWTDATGRFHVTAVLIQVSEKEVTLRKPDLTELKLALEKLSGPDRMLAVKAGKAAEALTNGPFSVTATSLGRVAEAPALPAVESLGAKDAGALVAATTEIAALVPDAAARVNLRPCGIRFPMSVYESPKEVFVHGGTDGLVLLTLENITQKSTKLVWCSFNKRRVLGAQFLPEGEKVVDYHPASHRLLTIAGKSTARPTLTYSQSVFTVWEAQPGEAPVKGVVSWQVDGVGRQFARLVSGTLVLHKDSKGEVTAWDLEKKQARYRWKLPFTSEEIQLSSNRKYALVPNEKGVVVYETETGKSLTTFAMETRRNAFGLSDDGRRLAFVGAKVISIWNVADVEAAPQAFTPSVQFSYGGSRLAFWEGRLLTVSDSRIGMFSLEKNLPLWDYTPAFGSAAFTLAGSSLVYAASTTQGIENFIQVSNVNLPGPLVEETEKTLTAPPAEGAVLVDRGATVKLEVNAGAETQQIRATLEKKIAENGWKLGPNANIVITAQKRIGKDRVEFYGANEKVLFPDYMSRVEISAGGKTAWSRSEASMTPQDMLRVPAGKTVAQYVRERSPGPDPNFFENLNIPDVIKESVHRGAPGESQFGTKGLTARKVNP